MEEYAVLIPAFKPDKKLLEIIDALCAQNVFVAVVDDGSGSQYAAVFVQAAERGAVLLRHESNRGKGAAIKTGIAFLMKRGNLKGIVTADADGQHTAQDICRMMQEMEAHPGALIIGSRLFTQKAPLRSRFGNSVTRMVFRFATGIRLSDTQSGLRGLPRDLFERLLTLAGERYDFEMNMLLNIDRWGTETREVPIDAAYLDGNKGSHFHPLRDSWRIYRRIAAFVASSLASTLADWGAFALLGLALGWTPWVSYVLARAMSSFLNYKINRHIVFGAGGKNSILKYYCLAVCIMAAGSAGVELLSWLGMHELLAKLLTDTPLFLVSYTVQRKYIFKDKKV